MKKAVGGCAFMMESSTFKHSFNAKYRALLPSSFAVLKICKFSLQMCFVCLSACADANDDNQVSVRSSDRTLI